MDKLDVIKMLTLSTGHLSENTRNLMNDTEWLDGTTLAVYSKEYNGTQFGWFVYANRIDDCEKDGTNPCPHDLQDAIKFARENNCGIICFDRDAETIPQLKTYE